MTLVFLMVHDYGDDSQIEIWSTHERAAQSAAGILVEHVTDAETLKALQETINAEIESGKDFIVIYEEDSGHSVSVVRKGLWD